MFSLESFSCDGSENANFPNEELDEEAGKCSQTNVLEMPDRHDIYRLGSECDLYQGSSSENGIISWKDLPSLSNFSEIDEMQIDTFYTAIQSSKESSEESLNLNNNGQDDAKREKPPTKRMACSMSSPSLELLKQHISSYKRMTGENPCPTTEGRHLSTGDVMRVAAARYIQSANEITDDNFSPLAHLFGSMLSSEEAEDVELVHLLLASAEKVGNQQYERASSLLAQCSCLSSNVGNPVQRVVYYFADALEKRINGQVGKFSKKGAVEKCEFRWGEDLEEKMMGPDKAFLAFHQQVPVSQVLQFVGVQPIIDNTASAKRIHLIDLGIRIGKHWSIVMQALAVRFTCPIELLKVTAVGTSEEKIKEAGQRLVSFAETLEVPFAFKEIIVSDMKDISEDLFKIEAEEVVGVYAPIVFQSMISRPDCLEHLLNVIKNLNPCIMVVSEVEANHNSPSFINRFIESLFYYSAWFDCLGDYMDKNDHNRMFIEGNLLSEGIRSIIATEGDERIVRHVGIDLWRSFIARSGFVETEQSFLSLYQANLLVKQFSCGDSLNLDKNGKGITVGWKGTELVSFTAWKLR